MTGEAERYNFIREKSGLSKKDFAGSLLYFVDFLYIYAKNPDYRAAYTV
jgi:hypothetical protein